MPPFRLPLALTFLLAGVSAALAAPPYEGRWSEDPAWCRNKGHTDEMPITITRRAVESFASSCRILSVARKGAVWRLRTSCRDEGESEAEPRTPNTFVLRLAGNRLVVRDASGVQTYTRCPAGA